MSITFLIILRFAESTYFWLTEGFLITGMPTFFDIYQAYLTDPRAVQFGKKKYKVLHERIHRYYDKWPHREPLEYVEVKEGEETFNVRLYPDNFVPRMKMLIISFAEKYKANVANDLALKERADQAKKTVEKPASEPRKDVLPKVKKRTRKPVQKPAFSLKK